MAATSSDPELMYFNGPGRANLTRLAFEAGGVKFIDTRVANWPEVKADPNSAPAQLFGVMPVIKHGDNLIGQSLAVALYAAELGIYQQGRLGETPGEVAVNRATDIMLIQTNEDLRSTMYKCLFGDDESKAKGKEALPAAASKILDGIERALARKTSPGPYFFSQNGPSLADLAVYDNIVSPFPGLDALGFDRSGYPKINALVDAVKQLNLEQLSTAQK